MNNFQTDAKLHESDEQNNSTTVIDPAIEPFPNEPFPTPAEPFVMPTEPLPNPAPVPDTLPVPEHQLPLPEPLSH